MGKFVDITGIKFNRLTAVKFIEFGKSKMPRWEFKCDCGKIVVIFKREAVSGGTKSCGCFMLDNLNGNSHNKIHGMVNSRIYSIHQGIMQRCENKTSSNYHRYGKRGIIVCEEWKNFISFYKWAFNNGYSDDLTIDRIDVNGNYEPINCRWATSKQQANNKTNNVKIKFEGLIFTVSTWAELIGVKPGLLYDRVRQGWPINKVLMEPVSIIRRVKS